MKREELKSKRELEIYRMGYSAGNMAKNRPSKRKDRIRRNEESRISDFRDLKRIPKWVMVDIAKEDIFTENVNQRYNEVDEFVCRKCGLHLMEWVRVEIDEDDGEELHYQYELKYCPECGRRVYDETLSKEE